jgi:transposase
MTDDLSSKICYLKDIQGLSLRQIAEKTGLRREKVSRLYSGTSSDDRPRGFLLDPYRDLIASWFSEVPSLKAVQVWRRLNARGVAVSRRSTEEYTEEFRKKAKGRVYWPLTFLPGEEAQVDWFFLTHPVLGKIAGFTMILSYSRFGFAHFFPRYSFEFFIEGHLLAFAALGGTPRALRYDNLRSVVIKREPLAYNPAFLDFAYFYGVDIRLCNPARGNEKGRVERLIRSIRDTFENTAGHHPSLAALNAALHDWMGEKNLTVHRATGIAPAARKTEEKLKPLPVHAYRNVVVYPPKRPTKTGLVVFDTNSYSIPTHLAGDLFSVHATVDRLDFHTAAAGKVASHPRAFERGKTFMNPLHRSVARLSEKAKRERIHAVIRDIAPETGAFLEENGAVGEDPCVTAYALFKLLKTESRGTLLSAVREALSRRTPRLKFILSSLQIACDEGAAETVLPQNTELLSIDYTPRSLEVYDDPA